MLLEFKVSNYRSFHQECVLRMDAVVDDPSLPNNMIKTGCASAPNALRSAVIYGANASGKSNILLALRTMILIIRRSFRDDDVLSENYDPFLLNKTSQTEKTHFHISFLLNKNRYDYSFSYDAKRVYTESLKIDLENDGTSKILFDRSWDISKNKYFYEYGNINYNSDKTEVWESVTNQTALFLTVAARFNNNEFWMMSELREYFIKNFFFLFSSQLDSDQTNDMIENSESRKQIETILKNADVGIQAIIPAKKKLGMISQEYKLRSNPKSIRNRPIQQKSLLSYVISLGDNKQEPHVLSLDGKDVEITVPNFNHSITSEPELFSLNRESGGTQKLYALIGFLLTAINTGAILVIDELENSIHPLLVERIFELFHDPKINAKNAQLIVATHSVLLLDKQIFRPDQIWIMSKNYEQESFIESLSEYEKPTGKGHDTYLNNYLSGRLGGTPIIRPFMSK